MYVDDDAQHSLLVDKIPLRFTIRYLCTQQTENENGNKICEKDKYFT